MRMTTCTNRSWIIGCGHIGQRVSHLLQASGEQVYATSHSTASAKNLQKAGVTVFQVNLDKAGIFNNPDFEQAKMYYFVPPQKTGETDQRMLCFLQSLNPQKPPRRIVYISTTGVYGNHDGKWITENTPAKPENARSKRRLHAENALIQFCHNTGTDYIILRVAGIYDCVKLPLARINAGIKILKPDIAPASNRIHAADLASICVAAMQSQHRNCIFNVADGNPSSISDYFIKTARFFALTPPTEIDMSEAEQVLSAEMLSYLRESKKIDNRLLLTKLNISLKYPDLTAGLTACKKADDNSHT